MCAMIEKLYRFLRNGHIAIWKMRQGSGQSAVYVLANTLIPLRG